MNRKATAGFLVAILAVLFAVYAFWGLQEEEIENAPDWMPLGEALQKAADENKLVFIDIYEPDCQWCRKLKREVYPSETARAELDSNFYPVKIDGTSDDRVHYKGKFITQVEFSAMIGVTAYPYLVVMGPDGEVIASHRGYLDVGAFSRFLNSAAEKRG